MFDTFFQLLITQNFLLFCETQGLTWCSFYLLLLLLLLLLLQPSIPKLTEPRPKLLIFILFIFSFNPQYLNSSNPNWVRNFVGISVKSCVNANGFPLYGSGACNFLFDSLTVKVTVYWWSELMETHCQSLDGEVSQNPFLSSARVAD